MDQITLLFKTFWKLSTVGRMKPKLLTLANSLCMISALTAPPTAPLKYQPILDFALGAQTQQEVPSHLRLLFMHFPLHKSFLWLLYGRVHSSFTLPKGDLPLTSCLKLALSSPRLFFVPPLITSGNYFVRMYVLFTRM